MSDPRKKPMPKAPQRGESGNIMAAVLGGVALTAILGITTFSLLSGPLRTIASVNRSAVSSSHVEAIARIALMDAVNQPSEGDCDGDSYVELRNPRDALTAATSPIEHVPVSLGAPMRDAWGNDYFYCTWDVGPKNGDAACGSPSLRADGSDAPFEGNAKSQTLVAAFSSGPDGTVQSSCVNYVDADTPVFTCAGDDVCKSYTYAEAGRQVPGIWSAKPNDPSTIMTDKSIGVGSGITIDADSGDAAFTTLNTTGKTVATGGLILGLSTTAASCDPTQAGKLHYNETETTVKFCDGSDWQPINAVGSGGSGGGPVVPAQGSEWSKDAGTNIFYNEGRVLIGTQTALAGDGVKIVSYGKGIETYSNSDTAGSAALLDLYHAEGSLSSPDGLEPGDKTGYVNFYGYTKGKADGPQVIQSTVMRTATNFDSDSVSFATVPAPGSRVLVFVMLFDTNASNISNATVTDNRSGTYTALTGGYGGYLSNAYMHIFMRSANIPAGGVAAPFTITLNPSNSATQKGVWGAVEVSKIAASSPVVDTYMYGTTSGTLLDELTTTAATLDNEIKFNFVYYAQPSEPAHMSGWNKIANMSATDATGAYKLVWNTIPMAGSSISHSWQKQNGIGMHYGAVQLKPTGSTWISPGYKLGAQIVQEMADSDGSSQMQFRTGNQDDTFETSLWVDRYGGMTVGPALGSGTISVNGKDAGITVETYNDGGPHFGSHIVMARARSMAGPTPALQNGDNIGSLRWYGWDGDSYANAASINYRVRGTVNDNYAETDMIIQASPDGSGLSGSSNNLTIWGGNNNSSAEPMSGGLNVGTPRNALHLQGIMRVTDTASSPQANNWAGAENFDIRSIMMYIPRTGYWKSGRSGVEYTNKSSHGFSSFTHGSRCTNIARNGTCIFNTNSTASTYLAPSAYDSIALNASSTKIYGARSIAVGSLIDSTYNDGPAWPLTENVIRSDYSTMVGVNNSAFGPEAHYATAIGGANISIEGSHSYAWGENITIPNVNPAADEHIFAVNLGTAAVTAGQTNTFSIMNGTVGVNTLSPAYTLHVTGTAGLSTGTTWTVSSDARLKDIHGHYNKGLRDITQLQPVRFNYKEGNPDGYDPKVENVGFIAQAVQTVFPEAVSIRKDGYLDFDMHSINVAKINAVKELHARQQALKSEQQDLLDEQKALQARIADLRGRTDKLLGQAGMSPRISLFDGGLWVMGLALPFGFMIAYAVSARRKKEGRE